MLCDNAPSHKHDSAKYPHVRVEFLAPNLTAWIQPMDAGIIAAFKAHYKRLFTRYALERDDKGITNIYKIEQLDAMRLADAAWCAVTPQTIYNCWRHTGICPQSTPSLPLVPSDVPVDITFDSFFDIPFNASFDPAFEASFGTSLDRWFDVSTDASLDLSLDVPFNAPFGADPLALPHPEPSGFEQGRLPTELEQLLSLIDLHAPTEHEWTDQEIVDQIIAERDGGHDDDNDEED